MPAEQLSLFGYDSRHRATWSPRDLWLRLNKSNLADFSEDQRVERKTVAHGLHFAHLAEYFSMWSNTVEGGLLILGVENDGRVSGCHYLTEEHKNRVQSFYTQMCPGASPEYKFIACHIDGLDSYAIAIYIPYRGTLVETNKGEAYIRRGEAKHRLTPEEKDDFRSTRHERSWEQRTSVLAYPFDFRDEIIQEFCKNFRDRESKSDWTAEEILADRLLIVWDGKQWLASNALVLFAAKAPRSAIPGCRVRVQRFQGLDEGAGETYRPIKDFYIEGCIPLILQKASAELAGLIYDVTWLNRDGKFVTTSEYPQWAWFEAVVNALVHRAYIFSGSEISVKFFSDRLEVESPGGFVPPVNAENVYSQRASRNPHLMEALRYLGFVRMTREGTRRMKESMEAWNLPAPLFSQESEDGVSVRVTLRNDHQMRKRATDKDVATYCGVDKWRQLAEHEIAIIGYAFNNGSIQVAEAERLTKRRWNTSKKDLDRLVEKGLLNFVAGKFSRDPKAHYSIKRDNEAPNGIFS